MTTTLDNIDHNVISFSGGKDSTAMLLLAIERDTPDLSVVFADTGNEHEQTYDYVRYIESATGVPIRWVKADFARQIAGKREFVLTKWADKWGAPQRPLTGPLLRLCRQAYRFWTCASGKGDSHRPCARFAARS